MAMPPFSPFVRSPCDLLEAYSGWGKMQARDVVKRTVSGKSFSDQDRFFIERFTGKVFS